MEPDGRTRGHERAGRTDKRAVESRTDGQVSSVPRGRDEIRRVGETLVQVGVASCVYDIVEWCGVG